MARSKAKKAAFTEEFTYCEPGNMGLETDLTADTQ